MLAIAIAVLALLIGVLYSVLKPVPRTRRRLPPGPTPLPIIGNLHLLGALPHRALRVLALKHGPVMRIRLGRVSAVVISSSAAAEQVLKAHDSAFASRPSMQAVEHLNYGRRGIGFTEYGPYWRGVRKLCTLQLLTAARVESFAALRRGQVLRAVEGLREAAAAREAVDLSERVSDVVEELTFKMMFGAEADSVYFRGLAKEAMRLVGAFNLADYVPFLGVFDLQGLTRKVKKLGTTNDEILEKIIRDVKKKSEDKKLSGNEDKSALSFTEVLLSLMDDRDQEHSIELINVKAILVDMIAGSFDTAVTAIEWALSELIKNPGAMARVHSELNDVVGLDRTVEEVDLPRLTYLEMAIMESFRLHPVAPFLIPRESMEDVEIDGLFIPKKTRVLVNSWVIGRDPSVWPGDPEEFVPERFEACETGFRGNDFRFLPFGAGRRGCPGMHLGLATIRLVVAQFVHCFTWELPDGKLGDELDMAEKFGLTLPRAEHLLAVPTFRLRSCG